MRILILLSFSFYLTQGFENTNEWNQTTSLSNSNQVLFKDNKFKCRMFRRCNLELLLKDSLNISQLVINSSNEKIFKFIKIQSCNTTKCTNDLQTLKLNHSDIYNAYSIEIESVLIGKASLNFTTSNQQIALYYITIIQPKRIIDILFDVYIYSFGLIISLLMGILLDKKCIINIFKMPKPMIIGFFCQYIIMPLLSFSICKIFQLTPLESLALFIYGCSPGGAGSNNWTILFNGDLDLSAVLTFVSVLSSMVMMPFWIYTLGTVFSTKAEITIPIIGLLGNLLITIVPCIIGLVLSSYFTNLKKHALKIAKPFTLIFLITFLILAFVTKFYSFKLLKLTHWFSGPLIPWFGYLLGGSVAWTLGLPFNQVKTVAIETGIQNVGVPFLIIFTNLPSPEADYAALPIIGVATLTNIPLYFALLISKAWKRFNKKDEKENVKEQPEKDPMLNSNK